VVENHSLGEVSFGQRKDPQDKRLLLCLLVLSVFSFAERFS